MAKLVDTFDSPVAGKQGVLAAVLEGGNVYAVQGEINDSLDAAQWVAGHNAEIVAGIPTNGTQVTPEIVIAMLDDAGEDTSEIIDGVDDIVDLFPHPAQRRVLWAIVRLVVNLVNTERAEHGRSEITYEQAKTAIVSEYKGL